MPRRHRPKFLALLAIPLALAVALAVGGRWMWDTARLVPDQGGTYVEAVAGRPHYINPLLADYSEIDQDLSGLIFSGLVRPGANGQMEPDLASGWQISADGKSYTFHLAPGRKWHDGMPVSADDVVLTVKLLQDPGFPGLPDRAAPWRGISVAKIDAQTVRFELPEPFGPFLEQASIGLLPAHIFADIPASQLIDQPFNGNPVGTGRFKVAEVDATQIALIPDPSYPGPKPYLDSLVMRFYPSTRAAVTAVLEGTATAARYVPLEQAQEPRNRQDVRVLTAPNVGRATVLFLNNRKPPFDSALVRQAVAKAIDREALVNAALAGAGEPAYGPISPLELGGVESTAGDSGPSGGGSTPGQGWLDERGHG